MHATPHADMDYASFLSRTATEFLSLPTDVDIYTHIAERLHGLVGHSVVSVSSLDNESGEMYSRALVGLGDFMDTVAGMIGVSLVGMRRELPPIALSNLRQAHIMRLEEDLYDILFREVPRVVTLAVENLLGIRHIYCMGMVSSGRLFGYSLVFLRHDNAIPPVSVLEAFLNQAGIALQRNAAEKALRESESKYRTLMQQAAEAYFVIDPSSRILEANDGACRTLGYDAAELVGQPLSSFMIPTDTFRDVQPWSMKTASEPTTFSRQMRKKDGSTARCEVRVAELIDGTLLVTARDMTQRRMIEKQVMEIGLRERRAIGHDLHDSLGQHLAGLTFLCEAFEHRLSGKELPESAQARRITELARDAVVMTRRIALGLCPVDMAAEGLAASLRRIAEETQATYDIACDCRVENLPDGCDDSVATHVYHIAREAVNNAARHAAPKSIQITLTREDGQARLVIADDGAGIKAKRVGGMGLRIMEYRAEMLGGTFSLNRTKDPLTLVTCEFPLHPAPAS